MSIGLVPLEYVPMEWPRVFGLLEPAVDRSGGRWSMGSLLGALCRGERQLWTVIVGDELVAAATTQVVSYPHKCLLSCQFMGGEGFNEWGKDLIATLERYAKDYGCDGFEAIARLGFWPVLKELGYTRDACVYDIMFEDQENG